MDYGEVGGARMVADLRDMARGPMAIFERFMGELQRITGDKAIQAPVGVERVKVLQAATVREIEESLQRFRDKVGEAEAALAGTLRPPRRNLAQEIRRTTQHLQRLMDLAARREDLLQAWEDQPAEAILEGYRAALQRDDVEMAEIYEADAERFLRRGGDAATLQCFLELRAQTEEDRLTPSQKQAKASLEEIERLKRDVALATRILSSTLRVSGSLAAMGAGWRKGSRVRPDPEAQGHTAILILPGPHPGMTATLVDASPTGVRLGIPEELAPGAVLNFIVRSADGRQGELRMQGEVRWCKPDGRTPGRFLAGVRLISRAGDEWITLVGRLSESGQDARAPLESRGT